MLAVLVRVTVTLTTLNNVVINLISVMIHVILNLLNGQGLTQWRFLSMGYINPCDVRLCVPFTAVPPVAAEGHCSARCSSCSCQTKTKSSIQTIVHDNLLEAKLRTVRNDLVA